VLKRTIAKTMALTCAVILLLAAAGLAVSFRAAVRFDLKLTVYYFLVFAAAMIAAFAALRSKMKPAAVCVLLFTTSFLFIFTYSRAANIIGENDLQFYFNNAIAIYENGFQLPSLYAATFPGTVTYPAFLAVLYHLFMPGRMIHVLLNAAVMSSMLVMLYVYIRSKYGQKPAVIGSFLLSAHPFIIIYSNTCNAELLYFACVFTAFTALHFAADGKKASYPLFAVSAVSLGLSLFFRPLGIIMLIAILLYLFVFSKLGFKKSVCAALLFIVYFGAGSVLCGVVVKAVSGYDAPGSSYGWNLYVGASETGRWNHADADEFAQVLRNADTPDDIQSHFAAKAVDRYREMGFGIFAHAARKIHRWHSLEYMADETVMLTEASAFYNRFHRNAYQLIIALYYIPFLLFGMAACILKLWQAFRLRHDSSVILPLYITGSFIVLSLLEMAPRYAVSYHLLFAFLSVSLFAELYRTKTQARIAS
jgi:4-amino-4-deoxy-L-arabinose transferase-like glycosyltransferase